MRFSILVIQFSDPISKRLFRRNCDLFSLEWFPFKVRGLYKIFPHSKINEKNKNKISRNNRTSYLSKKLSRLFNQNHDIKSKHQIYIFKPVTVLTLGGVVEFQTLIE